MYMKPTSLAPHGQLTHLGDVLSAPRLNGLADAGVTRPSGTDSYGNPIANPNGDNIGLWTDANGNPVVAPTGDSGMPKWVIIAALAVVAYLLLKGKK